MRRAWIRSLTTCAAVCAVGALGGAQAGAVQTSTFKLAATGDRTRIVHGFGNGAVHDSFVVANLSSTPLTIALDVVDARPDATGRFALGSPGAGFASDVQLAQPSLHLGPHRQVTQHVTIRRPSRTSVPIYAAITAEPVTAQAPGISVQTRLALLVEIAPHPERSSTAISSTARAVAVSVAAALLLVGVVLLVLRRRRGVES